MLDRLRAQTVTQPFAQAPYYEQQFTVRVNLSSNLSREGSKRCAGSSCCYLQPVYFPITVLWQTLENYVMPDCVR